MTAITLQLDDDMAALLRRLADSEKRSEADIVREALDVYVQMARPLPKGMGKYHSGQSHVSEEARDLVRRAVKDDLWP